MVKYLTGVDYTWLCNGCKKSIDMAHDLIISGLVGGQYIDDNEGPCMLAYDKGLLCEFECPQVNE